MLKLFKIKSLKNTNFLTSNRNERTQEKAILKEWIGTSREAFVSRGGRTRASLFGTYTPSKMGFAVRVSKKQRGRSMVEMLGVLAIIGVLSIGGIQGYKIAMRRHQANEILQTANTYATIVYTNAIKYITENPNYFITEQVSDDVQRVKIDPNLPREIRDVWNNILAPDIADLGIVLPGGINRPTPLKARLVTTGSIYKINGHDFLKIRIYLTDRNVCRQIEGMLKTPYVDNLSNTQNCEKEGSPIVFADFYMN